MTQIIYDQRKPGTKKPTGLSITRSGSKLICTWKIGAANYGAGQQFKWRTNKTPKDAWNNVEGITTTQTKETKTMTFSNYSDLSAFRIKIRGRRRPWTEVHHERGGEVERRITNTPEWSAYAYETFKFQIPDAPSVSFTLDENDANRGTFSWSAANPSTGHKVFNQVRWQTRLLKNSTITDGAKAFNTTAVSGTVASNTAGATGSRVTPEDSGYINKKDSYTRWFRVRSEGPAGQSDWKYKKHVYAMPNRTTNTKAKATKQANGHMIDMTWNSSANAARPIDKMVVQYAVGVPGAGMTAPASLSPTDVMTLAYKDGTDGARFVFSEGLNEDEALFVRVNTWHDENENPGNWIIALTAALDDPDQLNVTPIDATHIARVAARNNATVPGAFLACIYKDSKNPGKEIIVGIIAGSDTYADCQCPNWDGLAKSFGVRAYVGKYTAQTRTDGVTIYTVKAYEGKPLMASAKIWDNGQVPKAPTGVTVTRTNTPGTVRVTWNNNWTEADATELAWADHADAWESTDPPSTFEVDNIYSAAWNISGLELGKTWYIRVRLLNGSGDEVTPGPWSDIYEVDLSEAPNVPALVLSQAAIPADGTVTASWYYESNDGTPQAYAEITEVTIDANGAHYGLFVETEDLAVIAGKTYYTYTGGAYTAVTPGGTENPHALGWFEFTEAVIATTTTAQHIDLAAEEYGWAVNNTYNLAVRVASASGNKSEWSAPVPVLIVEPLTINITQTSLETMTIDGETVQALTDMPFTCTVTGAGSTGTTTVAIERAASYFLDRPDERTFTGHEGETIALYTQTGDAQITIDNVDLIGTLDDGAHYRLVATIQDGFGQSAEETIDFEVHWNHQAAIPSADILIDNEDLVAFITPIAPAEAYEATTDNEVVEGKRYFEADGDDFEEVTPAGTEDPEALGWYELNDTCDIYRLSVDRPELIFEGAEFGKKYVDPYPTLGEMGGHRIVFRTKNGDYITPDNTIAWADYRIEDGDGIETMFNIIDFNGEQARLMYDINLNAGWEKDFTATKYLGGHIQGDWNAATSRSGSVAGDLVTTRDQATIQTLRRLADFPGICHVRTRDGSSYAADVQVSESRDMGKDVLRSEFSLSITRVDPEGFDGVLYEEWIADNDSE